MFLMNLLAILYLSCLINLMSLENADGTPVRVPKFPSFNYKEVKTSSSEFKPQEKAKSSVDQQTTKLLLNLWAKAFRSNQKDNGNEKDKDKNKNYNDENKELALVFPKFTKNRQGNWVAFKWGPTPAGIWQDTRFNQADKYRALAGMTKDESYPTNYYPGTELSKVCFGRTTIYNKPKNSFWLRKGVHINTLSERVFWNGLRREIYYKGRSDECHDPVKYTRWLDYQECALKTQPKNRVSFAQVSIVSKRL